MFTLHKTKPSDTDSAFEELVRRHEGEIYRLAYRLTGNHEDAEDLVQEALLEAYASFARFKVGTYFDRWLYRILRNTFIDGTRARPKFRLQSLETVVDAEEGPSSTATREIVDWSSHPETRLLATTLDEPLQQALMALPEDFRLIVVLSDVEGLTYEEVSRIAGCPIGTVRSRLHRARMLLKEKLNGYLA